MRTLQRWVQENRAEGALTPKPKGRGWRSRELMDGRLALQERIASAVVRVALDQRTLVDSRFALQADREELERRSRTLAADMAVYEAQRAGHFADLALVTKAEAEVDRPTP